MAALQFTDEEFAQVLRRAQELYATIDKIRCPYFSDTVIFNAQGLEHLRRKVWNRGRSRSDQFMRLKYLAFAREILLLSRTVQGIEHTTERHRRHKHGRWEEAFLPVTYYEFVAVLKERRFKVIIKQTATGERLFWSLIPFWRQTDDGGRLLHDGDPAEE